MDEKVLVKVFVDRYYFVSTIDCSGDNEGEKAYSFRKDGNSLFSFITL